MLEKEERAAAGTVGQGLGVSATRGWSGSEPTRPSDIQKLVDDLVGDPERLRLTFNSAMKAHNKAARVAKAKRRRDGAV